MNCRIYVKFAIILLLQVLKGKFTWGAIVVNPQDTSVIEGQSASLYCQFSVPPKTTTKCGWIKDNIIVEIDQYNGIYEWLGDYKRGNCGFKISNTTIERDDALWACQLPGTANSPGETSNPAKLTVYVMPTPPAVYYNEAVLLSGGTLDVPLNTSVPISCFSRHGNPTPTLSWIFNNEPIQQPDADKIEPEQNKKTYTRSIELRRPFTKDDDGKTLRCTLMHITLNTSLFIDTVLNISYATTEVKTLSPTYVVVDAGSGYDFRCVADGNPPPKCEWFYKKEDATNWEIKSYNCVYSITSASEEHEGQYMCLAGNKGLLPSPEITLEIRSKTRNVVAIVGGVVGVILIIAVIILAIIVFKLRKNVQKSAQLPDIDFLNRSISKPKDDNINRETTYMIPIPDEQAPLNPPPFPKLPPLPKFPPPPTRESIESNIYAEPHFYHTISFSDETHEVKHEGEDEPDEGYIHLEDELDSPEVEQDVDLKKPVIVGMTLKQPVKDSDEAT